MCPPTNSRAAAFSSCCRLLQQLTASYQQQQWQHGNLIRSHKLEAEELLCGNVNSSVKLAVLLSGHASSCWKLQSWSLIQYRDNSFVHLAIIQEELCRIILYTYTLYKKNALAWQRQDPYLWWLGLPFSNINWFTGYESEWSRAIMQPDLRDHMHTSGQRLLWCHGAQTESWLTASFCKPFSIEVSALNSVVHLFSNGVTVGLRHERYL